MYALKEISTGKWLSAIGDTFVTYDGEQDILEAATEAALEDKRDAFNAAQAGRTGIFSSPRPH